MHFRGPWPLITFVAFSLLLLWHNFDAAEQWSGRKGNLVLNELKEEIEKHRKEIADLHRDVEDVRRSMSSMGSHEEMAEDAEGEVQKGQCNIFAMWNYPSGPPMFIQKNLESWVHYSQGRCRFPWLINETNIREFIPDLPAEYDRMPPDYDAAKSDVVRYALLYHHGGIYLDTDFLVARDLSPVLDRIEDHDIVSYTTTGQACHRGTFSSNFLAGRKGSSVFEAIWNAQKEALSNHCDDKLPANDRKVCCSDDLERPCHIPWAGIGENVAHPVLKNMLMMRTGIKIYCFEGKDSFVPQNFLDILKKHPKLDDAVKAFQRSGVTNPLERLMYHLFASQGFGADHDGATLFDPSTFVGHLYRKSVGSFTEIPRDPLDDGPGFICANDGDTCKCNGKVFYGRRFQNDGNGVRAELKDLIKKRYVVKEVHGRVQCTVDVFGDPIFTVPKHCVCQPRDEASRSGHDENIEKRRQNRKDTLQPGNFLSRF
ncbi:unnamed protein product [Durusdinium trenchii]|uniref:Uncharacterized protein n=1 Tax=Durusdinium trenchii TaxID=1381693 RepID=A0ABP0I9N3_9DINO